MARFGITRRGGTGGSSTKKVRIDYSEFYDALAKLGEAGAELVQETMPVIAEVLASEVLEVFEKEGAVAGAEKWPDFWWQRQGMEKPKTRRFSTGVLKLLQDTGVLVGSITPYSENNVAEAFSNVPYAGYHVSQRARQKIPLRDFTAIDFERAQQEATEILLAQLAANIGRP